MARCARSAVLAASSFACVLVLSDGYGGSAGVSQGCSSVQGQAIGGTESVLLQMRHQQVQSSSQSSHAPGPCRESCSCWSRLADAVTCGARIRFVVGLSNAAQAVHQEFPDTCSCGVAGAPSEEEAGPCRESCACWMSLADNHTCKERIRFLADRHQDEPWSGAAATAVQQEHPEICFCTEEEAVEEPLPPQLGGNVYTKEEGIGAWGGWCTCPDGQRYNVGDRHDACMHGPSSLACEGGVPGECRKEVDASRAGMSVKCAAATVAATPVPTPTPNWSYRPDTPGWGWQP